MVKTIKVGHLYPKQMNVYGDMGNFITLRYRLEARGFKVEYLAMDSAKDLFSKPDIVIGGGGQDSNQDKVQADLMKNKQLIIDLAEGGTVMLMICGMYQLFGNRFVVSEDHVIDGIGVFDAETLAGGERLIGNVVVESAYGSLVGFENHSGKTRLGVGIQPLGRVVKGSGNNGETGEEGAVYNNVFGSYLHGPLLAKNPKFADILIKAAIDRKFGGSEELLSLDDSFEITASEIASKRPR